MSLNVLQQPAPTPQPPRHPHANSGRDAAIWIAIAVAVFSGWGHRCDWWRRNGPGQPTA
ncbi:MAG TPA: hypothetical protein VJ600_01220 [Holophagaceae bacterium]|nr:hypothetical protein [Holophagaceae bacterium]